MWTAAYLFALILGGVLLGASILLGGHEDAGVDADADADADASLDLHGDGQATLDKGVDAEGFGSGADFFWAFRSIRFWTFFLTFFGLTGLALDGLGLTGSRLLSLSLALATGAISGFSAAAVLRWLQRDESGSAPTESDYIGKSVRVLVPMQKGTTGKVRLELKGSLVDVLATTDEPNGFSAKEEALIIEMDGDRARIARVDES